MTDDEHDEATAFDPLDALAWNLSTRRNIRDIIDRYEDLIIDREQIKATNLETILEKQIERANELELIIRSDPQNMESRHRMQKEIIDLEMQKGNERTGFWRDVALIVPRILDLELEYKTLVDQDRL